MITKAGILISCLLLMIIYMTAIAQPTKSNLVPSATRGQIIGSLAGNAQAVAVQGNYAYVGFQTELAVIDISDKTNPIESGRLEIGELVREIAVSEDFAYLATNSGLQIINISNPENLQWVGIYEQVLVTQVQIRGEFAFILSRYGLDILSITNAPVITLIGKYEADIPTPLDLDLIDKYAFLLDGYPNNVVHVVDFTNENEPLEVFTKDSVSDRIAVTNNRYLAVNNACSSVCFTWLSVLSWNPGDWTFIFIGAHDVFDSWWSYGLESNKFYAYVGKDIGLFVYNFHQQYVTGEPLQIDYYDIGDVRDIVAFDDYVYAVSADGDGIIHPPRLGGLFIFPAPPLHQTYFPIVSQAD